VTEHTGKARKRRAELPLPEHLPHHARKDDDGQCRFKYIGKQNYPCHGSVSEGTLEISKAGIAAPAFPYILFIYEP